MAEEENEYLKSFKNEFPATVREIGKGEYILCAAIYYQDMETPVHTCKNTGTGVVLCGHRHAHIIGQLKALSGRRSVTTEIGNYTQGFLTSKNRFVDRKEAYEIAEAADQIIIGKGNGRTLFSEDLY